MGDSILVVGPWKKINALRADDHDFVVMAIPVELKYAVPERRKAPIVIAIFVGMIGLSVFEVVPIAIAVLMAALATVLTRVLTMEEAYSSINWSTVILIAAMLPFADALFDRWEKAIVF